MLLVLTVPQAAGRTGRNPETIRRWIRTGRLRSTKVGTQHLVEERELDLVAEAGSQMLPLPPPLLKTEGGRPMPNVVALLDDGRRGR